MKMMDRRPHAFEFHFINDIYDVVVATIQEHKMEHKKDAHYNLVERNMSHKANLVVPSANTFNAPFRDLYVFIS